MKRKKEKSLSEITTPLDLVAKDARRKIIGLAGLRTDILQMMQDLKWRQQEVNQTITKLLFDNDAFDYLQVNWRRLGSHSWDKREEVHHDPGCDENPLRCDCF